MTTEFQPNQTVFFNGGQRARYLCPADGGHLVIPTYRNDHYKPESPEEDQLEWVDGAPVRLERVYAGPVEAWISVEDRLPELGDNVLAYGADDEFYIAFIWNNHWEDLNGPDNWELRGVTHWRPLPALPTA